MDAEYIDDYASCSYTYAVLRVLGDSLDPDEVGRALNLEFTTAARKGEPRIEHPRRWRSYRPALTGSWLLSSRDAVESLDLRRHIDWILEQVSGKQDVLKSLREQGLTTDVNCTWVGHEVAGPMLSPRQMLGLAELDLTVGISWGGYSWPPDDLGRRLGKILSRELGEGHPALAAGLGETLTALYRLSDETLSDIDYIMWLDPADRGRGAERYDLTIEALGRIWDLWEERPRAALEALARMQLAGEYPRDDEALARLEAWRQSLKRPRTNE